MTASADERQLASARPLEVTVYSRPGCHLCEEAKARMQPLLAEFGCTLREVNIDLDGELRRRYSSDIPVVYIGQQKAAKHRVDLRQFRRQLEEARAKAKDARPSRAD
jgi:glutaredoxin